MRAARLLGLAWTLGVAPPAGASTLSVLDPGQGPVGISDPAALGAAELSGLAYDAAADRYWAVPDGGDRLFRLAVEVDPATGRILSASVEAALVLRDASGGALPASVDLEGVAFSASRESVLVSDETGPRIREHRFADGREIGSITTASSPALSVFGATRSNLGWESLSLQAGDTVLWTANEEALAVDGPNAQGAGAAGTTVRLQRFGALGASFAADGQWAYVVDGDPVAGWIGMVNSGVSDLVALPDGRLLVLERAAGITANPLGLDFRSRLYLVDFAGASDVSALAGLASGGFAPVGKTLLWEGGFGEDNFEGIALGPALPGGARSLLLVSDDGSGQHQGVHALVLHGVPEPGSGTLAGLGLLALGLARRRGVQSRG
jgi:hypothetical protein